MACLVYGFYVCCCKNKVAMEVTDSDLEDADKVTPEQKEKKRSEILRTKYAVNTSHPTTSMPFASNFARAH